MLDAYIAGSMLHRAGREDGLAAGGGASDWSGRTWRRANLALTANELERAKPS
jgi:hypothetical protein